MNGEADPSAATEVAVIVQARMSSTRLPKKVLLPLAGAPALVRMMERVGRVGGVSYCGVATSIDPTDDAIADVCGAHDIPVTRGSLDDVLARFVAAVPPSATAVVRLTGDCPLIDPTIVERHIAVFLSHHPQADYVTNAVQRTQPDGFDVEVVSRDALVRANEQATDPFDREHVLPWVRRMGRMLPVTQSVDLSALRITLDNEADYDVIARIFDELYPVNPTFAAADVYRLLLRRPELVLIGGAGAADSARTELLARIERHLSSETTS